MLRRLGRIKMNVKEAIKKRKSIRNYQDKEVPKEIISELINAGRLSQSGNNAQPWRYKIITDKKIINKLKENNIFKQEFVYTAPVIIVCCSDPTQYPQAKFKKGFDDSYEIRAIRDLAFSVQNIALMATELGIGTCTVGWMNKDKIKDVLNLPEKYIVPYVLTLGYPANDFPATKKKKNEEILI